MNKHEASLEAFLPVMEHFLTIQGEGRHSGRAAYFVRLAGCDVGCSWCDVKESWDENNSDLLSPEILGQTIIESNSGFCVITGGEPCMHDLTTFTQLLRESGIEIAIETSGCYDLRGEVDWYCFSPKKFKEPLTNAYNLANEMKVVINHPSDFQWAEEHASRLNKSCELYLQPEWSKQERYLPSIVDYVKKHPKWKISLQTHKLMNIP